MKKSKPTKHLGDHGFTIIEFMIASVVFSVVLFIMISGLAYFLVQYYKISLSSSVQQAITSTSANIEQSIELSSTTPIYAAPAADPTTQPSCTVGDLGTPPNCIQPGYLCTSNDEYSFFIGSETPIEAPYALYQLTIPSGGGCTKNPESIYQANWSGGRSLLGPHYRLITFSETQVCNSNAGCGSTGTNYEYALDIKLAYTSGGANGSGDDLLCSPSVATGNAGNCAANAPILTDYSLPGIQCKTGIGSQFCDVTQLQSNVGTNTSE
jgi:prepilin-type N-terminal cleavage/methylation domain-containing protein